MSPSVSQIEVRQTRPLESFFFDLEGGFLAPFLHEGCRLFLSVIEFNFTPILNGLNFYNQMLIAFVSSSFSHSFQDLPVAFEAAWVLASLA